MICKFTTLYDLFQTQVSKKLVELEETSNDKLDSARTLTTQLEKSKVFEPSMVQEDLQNPLMNPLETDQADDLVEPSSPYLLVDQSTFD